MSDQGPLTFYVPDYEVVPGANTQAAVEAAVADAHAAPAQVTKIVRFRADATYTFATVHPPAAGVVRWHIAVSCDNLWIDGNGATVTSSAATPNLNVFLFNAAARTGGDNAWSYLNWATRSTQNRIDPATKGARTITLTAAGDAAGYAAGDWVLIRAGQTITTPSGDDQPDGEINRVLSVAGAVLTLEWPTAKPYRPELRRENGAGKATVYAGHPDPPPPPWPVGADTLHPQVANITDKMGVGSRLHDLTIEAPLSTYAAFWLHYFDWRAERLTGTSNGGLACGQIVRRGYLADIDYSRPSGPPAGGTASLGGGATCSVDTVHRRLRGRGRVMALHLHEGCAQTVVEDYEIAMEDTEEGGGMAISILARAYDTTIRRGVITGGNKESFVVVGPDCDPGVIEDLTATTRKTGVYQAVRVEAPGWDLDAVDLNHGIVSVHPRSTWRPKGQPYGLTPLGDTPTDRLPAVVRRTVRQWGASFHGLTGALVRTPDSPAISTGPGVDLDVSVWLAAGTTTRPGVARTIAAKSNLGNVESWILQVSPTGSLVLYWTTDGSTPRVLHTGGSVLPAQVDTDLWIRFQFDVDVSATSHRIQFLTSPDGITWSNLGSAQVGTGTTSVHDSATALTIGAHDDGAPTGAPMQGGVLGLDYRSTIGSVDPVARFRRSSPSVATWNDPFTGQPWAIIGAVGAVASSDARVLPPLTTTAARPASPGRGAHLFDTTLGRPIWFDGSGYVDATGAPV